MEESTALSMGSLILYKNLVNVITQENTILGLLYCNNNSVPYIYNGTIYINICL